MRHRVGALMPVLLASTAILLPVAAQQNPNLEQGLKPYGSYQGGNIDSISLTNGNLSLHIPLVSYPQRGGKLRMDFLIRYNNKGWQGQPDTNPLAQPPVYWVFKGNGVEIVRDQEIKLKNTTIKVQPPDPFSGPVYVHLYDAITADGSSHQLQGADLFLQQFQGESVDASGIMQLLLNGSSQTNNILIDRAGIRYVQGGQAIAGLSGVQSVEDPNGNKITISSSGWTDTLGRIIPGSGTTDLTSNSGDAAFPGVPTTDLSGCPIGTASARVWNLPGPSGGTSTIKMCHADYTIQSNFGVSWIRESVPTTVRFMNAVILPDQTKWLFSYNGTGDLTQITFPTGGTLSYAWTNVSVCNGATTSNTPVSRGVASRSLDANDGTGAKTWNYVWAAPTATPKVNVVTDPALNDTTHEITGVGGACSLYETKTQYFQGSQTTGTLLKTVTTNYVGNSNPRVTYTQEDLGMNVVATTITTTWPNGKTSQNTRQYDSGNTFAFYDATANTTTSYPLVYGSVLQRTESDYGPSSTPGPILRKTINSYLWTGNASYKNVNLLDLLSSVTVQDGAATQIAQTSYLYDETARNGVASGITTQHNVPPTNGAVNGNPTSVSRWLSSPSGTLTTLTSFYDTGMPYQTTDPGGHTTTFTYSATFAGAYVTQTQFPDTNSPNLAHHSISGNYDFNSGLLTSFTDENGRVSNFSYDTMWRFTTASFPDGGVTNFFYPDAITVERQQKMDASRWTDLFVRFDGLGREIRRITANDETTPWDQADTCYDARGFKSFVSYPYQGAGLSAPQVCSGLGDAFTYDGLGRTALVTHSDGTSVATSYTGPAAQVTDEGNGTAPVKRITQADGLGRLTSVCEVTGTTLMGVAPAACNLDIAATGFLTTYQYSYDALTGNLNFTVQQGGLNARTSVQDSLSRLTSATNPEAGTITYSYNSDSLLITRQAPAPNQTDPTVKVTTTYTYDELHRPRTRNYTGGPVTPSATINYDESTAFGVPSLTDTLGRQSSSFVSSGTTLTAKVYSYDPMGRVLGNSQCTPQNCATGTFLVSYTYDLIGDLLTSTNGLGTTLTYSYNRAARLSGLTSSLVDANHPGTPLSNLHYNAFGGETSASLGNGVTEALGYTARGWLQSLTASQNPTNLYSFSLIFASNGNVLTANDSVNGNWTYGYDDFNRLTSASKPGMPFTYDYDRFGNRWHQNGPYMSSLAFDANNRIMPGSGVSYDAAGNVTNDGTHSYTYDAENRITSVDGGTTASYVYNAAGERVRKTSAAGTVDYLYDLAGHVVTEVNASGVWTRREVYAGGRHVATYSGGATGTTYFAHADWLGTERMRTTVGGVSYETCTSLPFGDWMSCTGTDPSPLHFTGKERDAESGLDNFGARYYVSPHGRWLTPDWSARQEAVPYSDLLNPQTLNLYAYVGNNPMSHTDPDGHGYGILWKGETVVPPEGPADYSGPPNFNAITEEERKYQNAVQEAALRAQNQTPFNPTVTYDKNLSAKDVAADQSKVGGAVGVINANWSKLSDQEKATVENIKSIDVSGSAQRSYVQESTGKLTFTQDYVSKSSKGWLASAIGHDAEHVALFKSGGIGASRGIPAELKAMQFQLQVGTKFGLSATETKYLQGLIQNPSQLQQYINTPP